MDLILFGIQGSGKGTQAKLLAAEHGYDIFEAGGELRKIKATGSDLGKEVASYMDQGNLVPFEIIMRVCKEAIRMRQKSTKILFDGIPRDSNQKQAFDEIMAEAGREFRCIHLLLDEEETVRRILGRAAKEGRRDDADEESIRTRIGTFKEKTVPVIDEYKEEGRVAEVDGDGDVETVYERIKKVLSVV